MKKLSLLLLLLSVTLSVWSQHNDYAGFIITNEGDTVMGQIDFKTNARMANECIFSKAGENKYQTYKPGDIEGFRFSDNGKYYVTRRLNIDGEAKLYFAEYLVNGSMNLYYVDHNQMDYYFFENSDGELQMVRNNPKSKIIDENRLREIQTEVGRVRLMMKDSYSASQKMNGQNMTRENLVGIVKAYHKDVCRPGEDCIQYEYKSASERSSIRFRAKAGYGIITEFVGRNSNHDYSGSHSFEVGGGADIGLYRWIPGLSLQVSASYFNLKGSTTVENKMTGASVDYDLNGNFASLELGPQYTIGKKGLRPIVRLGVFNMLSLGGTEKARENGSTFVPTTDEWDTSKGQFGGYIGAGVLIPCGKHDISLHADYYKNLLSGSTFAKVGFTAEFVF